MRNEMPELPAHAGTRRPRPAIWTGAGALLTGAVWAVSQLAGPAQAHPVRAECASDSETTELRKDMRSLQEVIGKLNERLSRLEGRVEVKQSGFGH